jgi:hypothetical protein
MKGHAAVISEPDGRRKPVREIFIMVKASAVAKVLGGEKALGQRISSQQDLINAVRRGLRIATVEAVLGTRENLVSIVNEREVEEVGDSY